MSIQYVERCLYLKPVNDAAEEPGGAQAGGEARELQTGQQDQAQECWHVLQGVLQDHVGLALEVKTKPHLVGALVAVEVRLLVAVHLRVRDTKPLPGAPHLWLGQVQQVADITWLVDLTLSICQVWRSQVAGTTSRL